MLQELTLFVMKHWVLCAAFLVVAVLLLIEEIRATGPSDARLTPHEATHLINRENAVVVDVRDAAVFREGHIVNAKNIPFVDFDRAVQKLNRNNPVIVVDNNGEKTPLLVMRLKKAGFVKPCAVKHGMSGWKEAGMPVVKK